MALQPKLSLRVTNSGNESDFFPTTAVSTFRNEFPVEDQIKHKHSKLPREGERSKTDVIGETWADVGMCISLKINF